jgi:hypothetical protein
VSACCCRRHRVFGARQSPNGCAAPSMSGALDQDASASTTESSSPRRPWTAGLTTAGLKWTSVGPANPPTTPSSKPSTRPSGESAYRDTGSCRWTMSTKRLVYGRTTTTKPAYTARGAAWVQNPGAARGESTKAEHGEFSRSIRTEVRGHRNGGSSALIRGPKTQGRSRRVQYESSVQLNRQLQQ